MAINVLLIPKYFRLFLALAYLLSTALVVAATDNQDLTNKSSTQSQIEKRELIVELFDLYQPNALESDSYTVAVEMLQMMGIEYGDEFDAMIDDIADAVEQLLAGLRESGYQMWDESFTVDELRELQVFAKAPLGEKSLSLLQEMNLALAQEAITKMQQFVLSLEKSNRNFKIEYDLDGHVTDSLIDPEIWRENLRSVKCDQKQSSEKAIPVLRTPPVYPVEASKYSIEGWVELSFDVTEQGLTDNIRVTNGVPGTIFFKNAVAAVADYVYCKGKRFNHNTIRIVFEMEK